MLAMLLVSLISSFVLLCLLVPSVRMSIMAVDDSLDAHEAGLAMVASRKSDRAICICLVLIELSFLRKTFPREWTPSKHGSAYHATAQSV